MRPPGIAAPSVALAGILIGWSLPLQIAVAARSLGDLQPAEKEALLTRLQSANAAFDAGRFASALALYDALAAEVEIAEIHFRRGACLERLSRPSEAALAYRRYLALRPAAPDAGRVRFDIERLEAAAVAGVPSPQSAPSAAPAPATSAPPPADRTLPWAVTAVGGALGIGAGVLGWLTADAVHEANSYDRRAAGHSREALEEREEKAETLETSFWIVSGAALAAGIAAGTLFALSSDPSESTPAPGGGPSGAEVTVGFGSLRVRF